MLTQKINAKVDAMKYLFATWHNIPSQNDIECIARLFSHKKEERIAVKKLLCDAQLQDAILESEELFRIILESPTLINISPALYFYILIRRQFLKSGIEDKALAIYVANALSFFSELPPEKLILEATDFFYRLEHSGGEAERFFLYSDFGNRALILAGLFIAFLNERTNRYGAPSVDFYENIGKESFDMAANQRLSKEFELTEIYRVLAALFHNVRLALNEVSDRYLSFDASPTKAIKPAGVA